MNARLGLLSTLAALVVGLLTGSTMVVSRFLLESTDPVSLAYMRYVVGAVVLIPAALLWCPPHIRMADLLKMLGIGVGQFGLLMILLNCGIAMTSSGIAAILFSTIPLAALAFGALLGQEQITIRRLVIILIAVAGVTLAVGTTDDLAPGAATYLGVAAVLGAACLGGACNVLYRPLLRRYPALLVTAVSMFGSVVFLGGYIIVDGLLLNGSIRGVSFDLADWVAFAYLGLGSSFGILLWIWALKHASASKVTAFQTTSPIAATLLGVLWLGEQVTPSTLMGLGLVAAALVALSLLHDGSVRPTSERTQPVGGWSTS